MVYVAKDGTVHNNQPWNLERLLGIFWGFIAFIVLFFKTLTEPILNGLSQNNPNNRRGGGGPGGGGGGGGGPSYGRPGGGGPKKIGRIQTIADCNIPGGG